jgi:hypothetical protein
MRLCARKKRTATFLTNGETLSECLLSRPSSPVDQPFREGATIPPTGVGECMVDE